MTQFKPFHIIRMNQILRSVKLIIDPILRLETELKFGNVVIRLSSDHITIILIAVQYVTAKSVHYLKQGSQTNGSPDV